MREIPRTIFSLYYMHALLKKKKKKKKKGGKKEKEKRKKKGEKKETLRKERKKKLTIDILIACTVNMVNYQFQVRNLSMPINLVRIKAT